MRHEAGLVREALVHQHSTLLGVGSAIYVNLDGRWRHKQVYDLDSSRTSACRWPLILGIDEDPTRNLQLPNARLADSAILLGSFFPAVTHCVNTYLIIPLSRPFCTTSDHSNLDRHVSNWWFRPGVNFSGIFDLG